MDRGPALFAESVALADALAADGFNLECAAAGA
jgi:hypothetical protein